MMIESRPSLFWTYWNRNHPKLIVRKPSKDICGLCYQFHLGQRTTTSSSNIHIRNHPDNDDSSLQSGGGNEDNDDQDGALTEAHERDTQRIAIEIKQYIGDAASMRQLAQKVIKDAKTTTIRHKTRPARDQTS